MTRKADFAFNRGFDCETHGGSPHDGRGRCYYCVTNGPQGGDDRA